MELVRGTVEDTLNALLDAEADQLCHATRYERTQARRDRCRFVGAYDLPSGKAPTTRVHRRISRIIRSSGLVRMLCQCEAGKLNRLVSLQSRSVPAVQLPSAAGLVI